MMRAKVVAFASVLGATAVQGGSNMLAGFWGAMSGTTSSKDKAFESSI